MPYVNVPSFREASMHDFLERNPIFEGKKRVDLILINMILFQWFADRDFILS